MEPLVPIIALAVMGPIIGSAIGVMREPGMRMMYNMLSFAAGVMLGISFISLIPEAAKMASAPICALGVATGALAMNALDRLIPHIHPELCSQEQGQNLQKTATFLLMGIFLHNFPEGLAIGMGGVASERVSYLIAVAIAIHNIPEGICTSAPYYKVTGKRLKTFLLSASTALPIIAGYALARFIHQYIPMEVIGFLMSATAGLMIYISADELIPTSSFKLSNHSTIFSLIAGVVFVVLLGLA